LSEAKYIDLHIHSIFSSDGSLKPDEIIALASKLQFRTIAIADHDTVEGLHYINNAYKNFPIELIPAIEISTELNSRFYHILAYFIDLNNECILDLIKELNEIRIKKNYHRIKNLMALGLVVPHSLLEDIKAGKLIVGPTLANYIIKENLNKDHPIIKHYQELNPAEANILLYKEVIKKFDKEYEGPKWFSTIKAIQIINKAGAIAVLAHPGATLFYATPEDILFFKENGLLGIEVYSTYHNQEKIEYYKELANKLSLLITGGSDFHGPVKPKVEFGCLKLDDYSIVEKLKETYYRK